MRNRENGFTIEQATQATEDLTVAMAQLLPQLSATAKPPTREALSQIINAKGHSLLIARDEESGTIIGALTLIIINTPTSPLALIEDVVVDAAARGRGVGVVHQFKN